LLRISPPVALTLAQPDLFSRILQKLLSNKPLTRLNLLRIVQSICDASEEQGALISVYGLYDTISRLSEHDTAILVRDMASKLTRSCEGHELLGRSGGKRKTARRTSTSTISSALSFSQSQPPTPTSSRSSRRPSNYRMDSETRQRGMGGPISFRPLSREMSREDRNITPAGTPPTFSASSTSSAARSRLPRTNSTKPTRQSLIHTSPKKEDGMLSSPSAQMGPPSMVPNVRRQRQTSDPKWS